jgi:hypothetical protein
MLETKKSLGGSDEVGEEMKRLVLEFEDLKRVDCDRTSFVGITVWR